MGDVAIKVENLSKRYMIGGDSQATLRESLGSLFRNGQKEEFWALRDINFEIKKGEAIGIIGRNGAGKSTLLKILSRITSPTSGRVEINGRLASLLEVGTGFHPELTGRENIFLNGSLLGMTKLEIKSQFDEIVAFSGVERFIDTPVKHFSSGMYVRLAFAVAAHLRTEVLLVDEVLAVGDVEFQKKCIGKMDDVHANGKTILLVSHNYSYIDRLCNRILSLNEGRVAGDAHNVSQALHASQLVDQNVTFVNEIFRSITWRSKVNGGQVSSGEKAEFIIVLNPFEAVNEQMLRVEISDRNGEVLCILNNRLNRQTLNLEKGGKVKVVIPSLPLNPGTYIVHVNLHDYNRVLDETRTPLLITVYLNQGYVAPYAKAKLFTKFSYEFDSD